jgi:transcription elongation GreA/GreB family factor
MSATATVQLGTSVKVRGLVPGSETTLYFVPESESDYSDRRLPLDSILGAALIGAKAGDRIPLDTLDDTMELEVVEVQRIQE